MQSTRHPITAIQAVSGRKFALDNQCNNFMTCTGALELSARDHGCVVAMWRGAALSDLNPDPHEIVLFSVSGADGGC